MFTTEHCGLFITVEGPDGSGKSTQVRILGERLQREGYRVLLSREPGGTPIGMKIRGILLDPANQDLTAIAEMLLMFAARAQNVEQWILPALADGRIVLSDRFTDSSLVYQGAGRGLGAQVVRQVDRIACKGLVPDLTIVVDIDTETGLARAHARNRDGSGPKESRLDEQALEFHRKARAAYHQLAIDETDRVKIVDGDAPQGVVADRIWEILGPCLLVQGAKPA